MPWVKSTRDVALDPCLLRVEEVVKTTKLENKSRHARPFGWQDSLRAQCVFTDMVGGEVTVSVRWAAFLENPAWRQLDVVAHVQDWLPGNLDYVGRILRPISLLADAPPVPCMPAPSTPEPLLESSVQIEELSDDDVPEYQAALAGLLDEFRSQKRKFDAIED